MQAGNATLTRAGQGSIAYRRRPGAGGFVGTRERPGLVFLGGFMSNMAGIKAEELEIFAAGWGLPYLRFDYSGHGASDGAFTDGTIGTWLDDTLDVIDRASEGPQVLVGSSMGGWLALLAALRRPERVRAVVGVAAAPDFTEDLIFDALSESERARLARDGILHQASDYGDEPYAITHRLIAEARRHLLLRGAIGLTCPVHLVHGLADPDVPWRTALRILKQINGGHAAATFIRDGDHRLCRAEDLAVIGRAILDVIARGNRSGASAAQITDRL